LLPWDENRLVVEETYYSNSAEFNPERISRSLVSYVERHGWKIDRIEREESGVRPIPMTSGYLTSSVGGEPLPIGLRGGYFHAATGETLPDAVRIADFLVSLNDPTTQACREGLMKFRRAWLSRQRYYRLLNRLMFHASESSLRYLILQNFYAQPLDVIERFNASRSTWSDRMRILTGRPPVPLERALKSLREKSVQSWPEKRSHTDV
jgi:lycopene beta-cyclase